MKKIIQLFAVLAISAFMVTETYSQCEPDTITCIDTGNPGQICPDSLPQVIVNTPYDQSITVLAPSTFDYLGNVIDVAYIVVDSVLNLPPGIEYFASATQFYPDSAYCIQIVGTPTVEGDFPLAIHVTPFINYLDNIVATPQIVDDTSVVMTVLGPSGLNPFKINEFRVLPNIPNPFSEMTRLGFYTPFDDRIELEVYNILGELMHEERQGAPPGEHFFQFNGSNLFYQIQMRIRR
jgi:hypothetical protein